MVMSIFLAFRLRKIIQASITNQRTLEKTHFHSQIQCSIKLVWVKALFHRTKRICSTNVAFNEQIKNIKKLFPGIHTLNNYVTPY